MTIRLCRNNDSIFLLSGTDLVFQVRFRRRRPATTRASHNGVASQHQPPHDPAKARLQPPVKGKILRAAEREWRVAMATDDMAKFTVLVCLHRHDNTRENIRYSIDARSSSILLPMGVIILWGQSKLGHACMQQANKVTSEESSLIKKRNIPPYLLATLAAFHPRTKTIYWQIHFWHRKRAIESNFRSKIIIVLSTSSSSRYVRRRRKDPGCGTK